MTSPVNNFQDILDAMERNPALRDALRRHILTDELLQAPVRLERIHEDIGNLQEGQARLEEKHDRLEQKVDRMVGELTRTGGDVRRLAGTDYESHVATYVHRVLRRNLGINASVLANQGDRSSLTSILDEAEAQGLIDAQATDELDKADLVLTADGPTDYLLAEISITIQQDDIDRAGQRASAAGSGHSENRHSLCHRRTGAAGPPKRRRAGHPHPGAPDSLNHGVPATESFEHMLM